MIGLKVNGMFLDLPPNFNFPFVWESSLFSDEIVMNGFSSLPIMLPFTQKNKRLLNYFHKIENSLIELKQPCQLFLSNNLWCNGILSVSVKGELFDCDFSELTLLSESSDKKIKEILKDDEINIIPEFQRWWAIVLDPLTIITKIEFSFNINNQTHVFSTPSTLDADADMDELKRQCDLVSDMVELFTIERFTDSGEELIKFTCTNENTIDNNLNIDIVLIEGCKFGSTLFGSQPDWMGTQKNQIRLKLDEDVNKIFPDTNFCFPIIWNEGFYGENHPDSPTNFKLLNYYKEGYQNNINVLGLRDKFSLSPQLFIGFVFERLGLKLGFIPAGTFTEIEDLYNRTFIYNNRSLDIRGFDVMETFGTLVNFWRGKFYTGDHLPDATLKELLTSFKNYFSVGFFYRNGFLKIETTSSILEGTNIYDWSFKSFKVIDEISSNFKSGFILKYEKDPNDIALEVVKDINGPFLGQVESVDDFPQKNISSGQFIASRESKNVAISIHDYSSGKTQILWSYFCKFLHDYTYIDDANEIISGASQTVNDGYQEESIRIINIPRINQKGSSSEYELGENKCSIRFLQYFGLQNSFKHVTGADYVYSTDEDVKYPFAKMDSLEMGGGRLTTYSLKWEDSDGLFENFHKPWLDFLRRTKKVVIKVCLTKSELLQIDLTKKVKIRESQFLIEKIQGDISNSSNDIICTVDLKKI